MKTYMNNRLGMGETPMLLTDGTPVPRRRGFTLIELLMSIGIMGIGLVMAAALFPTAIKENQFSAGNSVGSMICENGLAVAQANLRAANMPTGMTDVTSQLGTVFVPGSYSATTHYEDLYCSPPTDPNSTTIRGFRLLAKANPGSSVNDTTLTAISYQAHTTDTVTLVSFTISNATASKGNALPLSAELKGIVGSPIVRDTDGSFVGRVVGWNPSTKELFLDQWPSPAPNPSEKFWYIQGANPANTPLPSSPGMYAMTTRTSLP